MRNSIPAFYVVAFVLSAVLGIGYTYGATCTHKSSSTCPGYGAANAINGNCCIVLYQIPISCGVGVKDVTEHATDLCGVLAPVNSSGNCGTNTATECGQKCSLTGCTSANCSA